MTYLFLLALCFVSVALVLSFVGLHLVRALSSGSRARALWRAHRRGLLRLYGLWFAAYGLFLVFGTGPQDLASYPPARSSPYRLPWRGGVPRLVAHRHPRFTSHPAAHP